VNEVRADGFALAGFEFEVFIGARGEDFEVYCVVHSPGIEEFFEGHWAILSGLQADVVKFTQRRKARKGSDLPGRPRLSWSILNLHSDTRDLGGNLKDSMEI